MWFGADVFRVGLLFAPRCRAFSVLFLRRVFVCKFEGYVVCQTDVVSIGVGVGCSCPVVVMYLIGWLFGLLQVLCNGVGCWFFWEGVLELVVGVQVFKGDSHPCLSN